MHHLMPDLSLAKVAEAEEEAVVAAYPAHSPAVAVAVAEVGLAVAAHQAPQAEGEQAQAQQAARRQALPRLPSPLAAASTTAVAQ